MANDELQQRLQEFRDNPIPKGKFFIDRIEDNGVAVVFGPDGERHNLPAQKGWKEGMYIPPAAIGAAARPKSASASGDAGGFYLAPPTGMDPREPFYPGGIEQGNIDVMHRPTVHNADGSTSSVRSMSTNLDGREVLMPTVSEDARIMSDNEAVDQFRNTGRHLGMFDSPESANRYAGRLHDQQEALGDMRGMSAGDMGPEARHALQMTQPSPIGNVGPRAFDTGKGQFLDNHQVVPSAGLRAHARDFTEPVPNFWEDQGPPPNMPPRPPGASLGPMPPVGGPPDRSEEYFMPPEDYKHPQAGLMQRPDPSMLMGEPDPILFPRVNSRAEAMVPMPSGRGRARNRRRRTVP